MEHDVRRVDELDKGFLLAGSLQPSQTAAVLSLASDRSFTDNRNALMPSQTFAEFSPASARSSTQDRDGLPHRHRQQGSPPATGVPAIQDGVYRAEQRLTKVEEILDRQQSDLLGGIEDLLHRNKDSYEEFLIKQIDGLASELSRQSEKIVDVLRFLTKAELSVAAHELSGDMRHQMSRDEIEQSARDLQEQISADKSHQDGLGNGLPSTLSVDEDDRPPTMEERPEVISPNDIFVKPRIETRRPWFLEEDEQTNNRSSMAGQWFHHLDEDPIQQGPKTAVEYDSSTVVDLDSDLDPVGSRDPRAMEHTYKQFWKRTNHILEVQLQRQADQIMNALNSSSKMELIPSTISKRQQGAKTDTFHATAADHEVMGDHLAPGTSYLQQPSMSFKPKSRVRIDASAQSFATGGESITASSASGAVGASYSSSIPPNGLRLSKTNMQFAQDLLTSNVDAINELTNAMQRHDLPEYWRKGKAWLHEPDRTSTLGMMLESTHFERFVSLVILANTVFITYSTDYAVRNPNEQVTPFITTVESLFQVFYILELMLKIVVHRFFFFTNKDFLWNILDCVLAFGAMYDLIMTQVVTKLLDDESADSMVSRGNSGTSNGFSLTFLRVLRLCRLTKVMRIFRVMRFFSELNVLLRVVSSSLRPLFWCTVMLVVFFYIFAVIFVHGTASCLGDDEVKDATKTAMYERFGSVLKSMLSLMKATTGGGDWGTIAEPLLEVAPFYYSLFLFFIIFVFLALLNILTGIFVDRAFKAVADDKDGMALEKLYTDRAVVADLCRLYCAMTGEDIDAPVSISSDTFHTFMSSPVMRARLAVLDLEIWDAEQFFKMLCSISRSHDVDLQSFVTGCMQLRGDAKRITMQAVLADVQRIKRTLSTQFSSVTSAPLKSAMHVF